MKFDYIIVGAGAAGCVLAARLSENPSNRVLMIEKGPRDSSIYIRMPGAVGALLGSGTFSQVLESEPEGKLNGRKIGQVRGCVLGGSSSVNGMMYLRGHQDDYDGWASAGCKGWRFADVLPYFKKSERHESRRSSFHGQHGPLGVKALQPDRLSPVHRAFLASGIQAGYGAVDDFNSDSATGFGLYDQTVANGKRASASSAYLGAAQGRKNLKILTNAEVAGLIFQGKRSAAVRILRDGAESIFEANREILVCAGTYASPQLLLLSGIGPAADLQTLGVKVVHDLPGVGENLHNHPDIITQFSLRGPWSLLDTTRFPGKYLAALEWLLRKTGPAGTGHLEAGALLKSSPDLTRPDLQLILLNIALREGSTQPLDQHAFQIHLSLLRPKSRGRLMLRSPDPTAPPSFELRMLSDQTDREAMHRGMHILRKVVSQPALAELISGELVPGAKVRTSDEIDAWLNASLISLQHPVGTCRMGAAADPMVVVDPELKVRGIEGLRVVDASVMPSIVAGNTYAPVMMIAERAADMILGKSISP